SNGDPTSTAVHRPAAAAADIVRHRYDTALQSSCNRAASGDRPLSMCSGEQVWWYPARQLGSASGGQNSKAPPNEPANINSGSNANTLEEFIRIGLNNGAN
ncbi:hypothetical protein IWW55_004577, partial [Coemansia sp. RSA 2706]